MKEQNFIIKTSSGRYTSLDRAYNKLIISNVNTSNEEQVERWVTYNQIIKEITETTNENVFGEIKYRLTGGEEPTEVILDVINRIEDPTLYLRMLKRIVEDYKAKDWISTWT